MECRHDPRSVGSEGHFPYPVGWSRGFRGGASRGVRRMGGVTAEGPERERGDPRVQRRAHAGRGARCADARPAAARRGHRRRRRLDRPHGADRARARRARGGRGPASATPAGRATAAGTPRRATSSSSSTPTPCRCPASARAFAAPRASSPARSSAAPGASRRTRPGRGSPTCRSRPRTSSAAGRATCSSCPRTACSCRERSTCASTRATAARTPCSARTRSTRGIRLVFDPRFAALHDHDRDTFAKLRRQQARVAFAAARIGPVQREGMRKRIASRVPLHYFALLRLPGHLPPAGRGPRAPPALRAPAAADGGGGVDARRLRRALRRPPAAAPARPGRRRLPLSLTRRAVLSTLFI